MEIDRAAVLAGAPVVDDTVHLVVDLALRIGELQLASGAGAADVTATILAVTKAYRLPLCEVIMMSARLGATAASGLAAIVVGFLGRLASRRLRLPPLVMAVAGITPLLPGLTTYRGVLNWPYTTIPAA